MYAGVGSQILGIRVANSFSTLGLRIEDLGDEGGGFKVEGLDFRV